MGYTRHIPFLHADGVTRPAIDAHLGAVDAKSGRPVVERCGGQSKGGLCDHARSTRAGPGDHTCGLFLLPSSLPRPLINRIHLRGWASLSCSTFLSHLRQQLHDIHFLRGYGKRQRGERPSQLRTWPPRRASKVFLYLFYAKPVCAARTMIF